VNAKPARQKNAPNVNAALELTNLHKAFNGIPALSGVNLHVEIGHLVTLLGPSGGGKTTTLRLIAGFEQPDAGQIIIQDRLVAGDGVRVPPEARRVGMVFQEYALFPHLTVYDNIAFGLSGAGHEKAQRVAEMLALVSLAHTAKRMPHELSGGQQQRIALARALAPHPDLLLLDEPFSNLDAMLRAQVRTEVRAILKRSGTTCVFVTHDQHEAFSLSDEVAVMIGGRVAQFGTPQTVYSTPASKQVAAFVGEANFVPGLANGLAVDCELGQLALLTPVRGEVDVLLRPEMLRLGEGGIVAQVRWREYLGLDQRVGLVLPSGLALVARTDASHGYIEDEEIGMTVNAPVWAFKRV
jgi:iron(III) transport system ATP-binding protein